MFRHCRPRVVMSFTRNYSPQVPVLARFQMTTRAHRLPGQHHNVCTRAIPLLPGALHASCRTKVRDAFSCGAARRTATLTCVVRGRLATMHTRKRATAAAGSTGWWPHQHRRFSTDGHEQKDQGRTTPRPRWWLPPNSWILVVIVGLNVAMLAFSELYASADPALLSFLLRHFTTSWENISQGRVWVLLTSLFLHGSPQHLATNTFVFLLGGALALRGFSVPKFVFTYLGGGVAGALAHLYWLHHNQMDFPGYGASAGAYSLYGAVLSSDWLGFLMLSLLIAWELREPVKRWLADVKDEKLLEVLKQDTAAHGRATGHETHVAGMLFGVLCRVALIHPEAMMLLAPWLSAPVWDMHVGEEMESTHTDTP